MTESSALSLSLLSSSSSLSVGHNIYPSYHHIVIIVTTNVMILIIIKYQNPKSLSDEVGLEDSETSLNE